MTTRIPTHRPPTSPGQMLREEFLEPLGLDVPTLAEQLGRPFRELEDVLAGRIPIASAMAEELARTLGTTPALWVNLQTAWDAWQARSSSPEPRG
jgi:addiction module HigA family antidote